MRKHTHKYIEVIVNGKVISRFTRPEAYKSINEARDNYSSIYKKWKRDDSDYPCLNCDGAGTYHKFEDRDIIEGYKLAPLYTCKSCSGSGRGPKEMFKAYYDAEKQKIKAQQQKFDKDLDSFMEAIQVLSPEQIFTLNKMLGNVCPIYEKNAPIKKIKVRKNGMA